MIPQDTNRKNKNHSSSKLLISKKHFLLTHHGHYQKCNEQKNYTANICALYRFDRKNCKLRTLGTKLILAKFVKTPTLFLSSYPVLQIQFWIWISYQQFESALFERWKINLLMVLLTGNTSVANGHAIIPLTLEYAYTQHTLQSFKTKMSVSHHLRKKDTGWAALIISCKSRLMRQT